MSDSKSLDVPINYSSPIAARIQQLRFSLLVTSYVYYELDDNLITDEQWNERARKLVKLQKKYPYLASRVVYADQFKGFEGSGYTFKYSKQIKRIAKSLLQSKNERKF